MLTSQNFGSYVTGVAFHPTKNLVASCSYDKSVKLWNADSGAELWTVRCDSVVLSVVWSPDGTKIVTGCGDGKVRIFDSASGTLSGSPLTGHSNTVSSVHFSPDGTRLVTGSFDKTVKIWNPVTGEELCQLRGHRYAPSLSKECFLSFR